MHHKVLIYNIDGSIVIQSISKFDKCRMSKLEINVGLLTLKTKQPTRSSALYFHDHLAVRRTQLTGKSWDFLMEQYCHLLTKGCVPVQRNVVIYLLFIHASSPFIHSLIIQPETFSTYQKFSALESLNIL